MSEWCWFTGELHKENIMVKKDLPTFKDYNLIAKDKSLIKNEILKNPSVLFKIIDYESNCMCGGLCGGCEYHDLTFFEIIIRNKNITEEDLLILNKTVNLDWYKISSVVPLSISTLNKFKDIIDWSSVSQNYIYKKTIDFINNFHDKLKWTDIYYFDEIKNYEDIESLVFQKKYIPIKFSIQKKILLIDHIKNHVASICIYCRELIKYYGVELLDNLEDTNSIIHENLLTIIEEYTDACIKSGYISKKYINILKLSKNIKNGDWSKFIEKTLPKEDFLIEHIINNASKETWTSISIYSILSEDFIKKYSNYLDWSILVEKNKSDITIIEEHINEISANIISKYQLLTPEFIDKYADKLDWYYICEYQELPDWLMRKHIDKLNWGQISWYQNMSEDFINEYMNMFNIEKIYKNNKLKSLRHIIR